MQGLTNNARQAQTRFANLIGVLGTSENLLAQVSPSSAPNQIDLAPSPNNIETNPFAQGDLIKDVAPETPIDDEAERVEPDKEEAK